MASYIVVHKVHRLLKTFALVCDFNKAFPVSVALITPTVSFSETLGMKLGMTAAHLDCT